MAKSRKGRSGASKKTASAVSNSKAERARAKARKEREEHRAFKKRSASATLGWERKRAAEIAEQVSPRDVDSDARLVANEATANASKALRVRRAAQSDLIKPDMSHADWVSAIAETTNKTLAALAPSVGAGDVTSAKTPGGKQVSIRIPLAIPAKALGSATQAIALFDAAAITGRSNQWPDGLVATASCRVVFKEKPFKAYSKLKYYAATQDWQTDVPSGHFRSLDEIGQGAQAFFTNIQKKYPTAKVIDVQIHYQWLSFAED